MAKKLKKAFTITELVIVIAVVAILAAVLIPTFANIINKAEESADTQTVTNINQILSAEEIINGKPETMHEAISVVEEGGYKVENLTPTRDGYDMVWDEENNRFALLDENGKTVYSAGDVSQDKWKLWKIVSGSENYAEEGYSYYAGPDFSQTQVTVSAGFDSGENENIAVNLNIPAGTEKDVTVRTNGGAFTVNAPESEVAHCGAAESVTVQAVAANSYHEYGDISGRMTINSGRVVLENGSDVKEVLIAPESGAAVSLVNRAANEPFVTLPSSSSSVTVEGVSNSNLNKTDVGIASQFAGGAGTQALPYLVETPAQFAAVASLSGAKFVKLQNDLYLESTLTINNAEADVTLDLNGCEITVQKTGGKSLYAIDNYATLRLRDNSAAQNGVIVARGVENFGTMYIERGTIEACDDGGGAAVLNEGTLYMTGGVLYAAGGIAGNAPCAINNRENAFAEVTGGDLISAHWTICSLGELVLKNLELENETPHWNCIKLFGGKALLDNVTIHSQYGGGIEVTGENDASASAILQNCHFYQSVGDAHNSMCVAVSNGGTATIKSGTYESVKYGAYVFNSGGTINIEGGTFSAAEAVLKADFGGSGSFINVSGGTFNGVFSIGVQSELNITGGTFNNDPTDYVETGYIAEPSGANWIVKKNESAA